MTGNLEPHLAEIRRIDGELNAAKAELARCRAEADRMAIAFNERGELLVKMRNAAPVMVTAISFVADEASADELREIVRLYEDHEPDHLNIWLDAEYARASALREEQPKVVREMPLDGAQIGGES